MSLLAGKRPTAREAGHDDDPVRRMSLLVAEGLTVRFGELCVVEGVSFALEAGQWLMLVGPNGAGKSTVVNALAQGVPYTGEAFCTGRNLRSYKPVQLAKRIGVLSQGHAVGYSFSVEEVVRLGRYAHAPGLFAGRHDEDDDKIQAAVRLTGLEPFLRQSVLTLSGGELQRTFLAQLLAQDPEILILDEPTNHLDLIYQKQVFHIIRDWLAQEGRAVISVVHDLSLARAFGTHALLLNGGKTAAQGRVETVLTAQNLRAVYGMDVVAWMREMLSPWDADDAKDVRDHDAEGVRDR
jgi:iron complex transport system ATP-binding protein